MPEPAHPRPPRLSDRGSSSVSPDSSSPLYLQRKRRQCRLSPMAAVTVSSRCLFPLSFLGRTATAAYEPPPPPAARCPFTPSGGSLTPAIVVIFLLLLLVHLSIFIVVGVTVRDALINPVNTVNPADLAMLFPRNVGLTSAALQGAPDLLPTSADSLIMPPPSQQMLPPRWHRTMR